MAGFDGCSTMEVFCKLNVVFIIMDLRLSVISIVAMIALPVFSQEDSIKTVHRIAADAVPATIFHTNEFLRGGNEEIRTMNHDMTFTLKYAFMNRDEVRPGAIHQGVYQGVGLARHEFNRWLANPISVYLFQGAPIVNFSRRVSLNYEWNLGMAFGWNGYDEQSNPENKVIGSKVTAYIDADLYVRWMLSKAFDLNAGISLSHFSNGNTTYPNMGLNTGGIRLGLAYYINRQPLTVPKGEREKLPDSRGFYTDVILYGAWKQGVGYDGYDHYLLPGKYGVMGFNVNPMYRLNPWLSLGASLDGVYDRSAGRENDSWGEDVNHKFSTQAGLGLSARGEFAMPYFSINFGAGTYLLGNRNDFRGVYEVLALKIHVSRRAMLHIGYSLVDFKTPNNLMLGLGWRFGGK